MYARYSVNIDINIDIDIKYVVAFSVLNDDVDVDTAWNDCFEDGHDGQAFSLHNHYCAPSNSHQESLPHLQVDSLLNHSSKTFSLLWSINVGSSSLHAVGCSQALF